MFGGDPVVMTINDDLAGVFPGTVRDFEFSWQDDGLAFGRYEAVLALAYDGEGGIKTMDSSLIFWIFPMKIIVPAIAIFIGIILFGYIFTKLYVNNAIMKASAGRRITPQRYRKQVGISRFVFVTIVVLVVLVIAFIGLLLVIA